MKETLPQFHQNPRFLKTFLIIGIFFAIVFASIHVYGQNARHENIEAKRALIKAAIISYTQYNNHYPESLQELLDGQFLNFIPKKPDGSEFVYTKLEKNNEVAGYELK